MVSTPTQSVNISTLVGGENNINAINFKDDGSELYVSGADNASVYFIGLGSNWNLDSLTLRGTLNTSSYDTKPLDSFTNPGRTRFIVPGGNGRLIHTYNMDLTATATVTIVNEQLAITAVTAGGGAYDPANPPNITVQPPTPHRAAVGYTIINDGSLPNNTIGITVDDADKSFLNFAWPKFKEKGFPVTLFVNTSTIQKNNKNYLNWDQIRSLKNQGVSIGGHSHSHYHLPDKTEEEITKDLEQSNKIFIKELGEVPTIFAYPYGETNEKIINLLKKYKFKVAFGQHSGVINETSTLYYLPRFSLNERYGDIDRFKFAANTKGLGVYDFIPSNPQISENPPYIGFSLLDQSLAISIDCFVFDSKGQVESETFKFNERVEIRLNRKLSKGRSRLNCTAKDKNNQWRWFGHQFYL